MNILEEIAAKTRVRVAENQQKITLAQMKEKDLCLRSVERKKPWYRNGTTAPWLAGKALL